MADKRVHFLSDGQIEFKGVIYPWKTIPKSIKFNSTEWFKHWESMIKEIKESNFDINQIDDISDEFKTDLMSYGFAKQLIKEHQKITELGAELRLAINQAYSNFRDSRKGFWGFIAGLFANKTLESLDVIGNLLNKK